MKIVDLSIRARVVEEMDRLDRPPDRLYRTLAQFQLVNRIFTRYRSVLTYSQQRLERLRKHAQVEAET